LRAIFHSYDSLEKNVVIILTGDSFHHLNVTRARENEKILILNGKGQKALGLITVIAKKNIELKILESETCIPDHKLSLAIAMPKKEAFEDILKISTELGINEVFTLSSEYSQYVFEQNERVQRILESALIQSNNTYIPIIHNEQSLTNFIATHTEKIAFFNSKKLEENIKVETSEKITILIGPEGGFSQSEIELISKYSKIIEIHLPTPILRAPTAVASSVGYLLSHRLFSN
jgi:16S rRNA (uracil1498-N3)-methyltransferase